MIKTLPSDDHMWYLILRFISIKNRFPGLFDSLIILLQLFFIRIDFGDKSRTTVDFFALKQIIQPSKLCILLFYTRLTLVQQYL